MFIIPLGNPKVMVNIALAQEIMIGDNDTHVVAHWGGSQYKTLAEVKGVEAEAILRKIIAATRAGDQLLDLNPPAHSHYEAAVSGGARPAYDHYGKPRR